MASLCDLESGRKQVAEIRRLLAGRPGGVHLVGVAGIGMAGLAVHLAARGFRVSGCDLSPNRVSDALASSGVKILTGHAASHITPDIQWLVKSTAVPDDSSEIVVAKKQGLPVYPRGAVLPALLEGRTSVAVTGTHGKTTTSAMIAQVLAHGGLKPGFCIGGEVTALGGVAAPGGGNVLVVEADESDGTVILYEPDIAVITNIEYDHMEHFRDEDTLVGCFRTFAANAKHRIIYCADDPRAVAVCEKDSNGFSYGFSDRADLRGTDIEENASSVSVNVLLKGRKLGRIALPVPGRHNAQNALGACAAAMELGLSFEKVRDGLEKFAHVRRRFETVVDRDGLLVISDYAHHPTEIRALVQTALQLKKKKVIGVFQPHRYTRTLALGKDFPPAFTGLSELVLVPVYEASESPIAGGTSEDLFRHFQSFGRVPTRYIPSLEEAWRYLKSNFGKGDVLLVIGAGDVEKIAAWAHDEFEKRTNTNQ
jgi:UDP-N-acetylmuramate--alanine ligase